MNEKDNWETPDDLFAYYNRIYHFVLDAAANDLNHKTPRWLGPGGLHEDALSVGWAEWLREGNIWLNPPYSRGNQRKFVEKAVEETRGFPGAWVVCLLPADTSTRLFHDIIKPNARSIEFIKGRIQFKGAPGKPKFASMIVVF